MSCGTDYITARTRTRVGCRRTEARRLYCRNGRYTSIMLRLPQDDCVLAGAVESLQELKPALRTC